MSPKNKYAEYTCVTNHDWRDEITTDVFKVVLEKLTEIEIDRITAGLLIPRQDVTGTTGSATTNTWILLRHLGEIAYYIDETDEDVRRFRIEPKIDELVGLYKSIGFSELLTLENSDTFEILRQCVSDYLSLQQLDPTRVLRVVILDFAVNKPIQYPKEYRIDRWARILVGKKSEWMVFGYLEGIRFQEDFDVKEFHFSSKHEALEYHDEGDNPRSEPHAAISANVGDSPPPVCYAISATEIYRTLYQLAVCLQLFTRIKVRFLMTHLRPYFTSSRDHLYKHWVTEENLFAGYYTVTPTEHEPLARIIEMIHPLLEDLRIQPNRYGDDYRAIAIKHYCDALLRSDSLEKVTAAVIALEALYGYEDTELSYRLRQRIARFVGPILEDYESILKTVKEAYTIRSKFLHGNKPKPPPSFIEELLKILCVSILLALLLKMKKKDFVAMIDSAMVDDNRAASLLESVNQAYGLIS